MTDDRFHEETNDPRDADRCCFTKKLGDHYQEAKLLGSAMVSLTTSHRSTTQAFLRALASACRNTTRSSGRKEITKSSPSCRIATFRLRGRSITPIRSDMEAPPFADLHFCLARPY